MACKLHGLPGMALVTNIAGAAGTTSGSSGVPTDSGGIAGLLAALTAIPGSPISPQQTQTAHSASGAPVAPTPGSAGSAGAEPQKALWAKVFDFYQHASVDGESALGAGQALTVVSAQDTAQRSGTVQAATTQMAAQQAAVATATASGMEVGSLAATESMLAASQVLPATSPAAAQTKVISIRAEITTAALKTSSAKMHSATQKEASAAQKSVASPASSSGMHIAAPVPPMPAPIPALLPTPSRSAQSSSAQSISAQPSPAQSSSAQSISAQPSPASSSAPLPGGLAFGASAVDAGLASGREAFPTTLPQPIKSGVVQSGSNPPGQPGQPSAQLGNSGNFSAAMAQTTYVGVDGAAKLGKSAQPIPPAVATMRLPELAAGERSLPAASTQLSAASSASQSIADVTGKPVSPTIPSQSVSTQASQTGTGAANITASGTTTTSLPSSSGGPTTQGQDLGSASTSVSASGSGTGHISASDSSAASKSGASMHGAAQPSGSAPQAGTWAATMAGHPGESPAMVMGATVTGATSGATSGAASVTATPANGHSAPAQHPGQVFESLDAATGAWNPVQTARMASGGTSLSVGYQDARLGYVELQARQIAGGVQATLVPSSEAARQALEGQLGSLGGWLAQRATPVDRLAVGMPSSMAAMTTDHGGAMNSGGAMDQGRTPNSSPMESMAQAAQQGLAGGASERGSERSSRQSAGESAGGNRPGLNAVGAVGGVESGSLTPAGFSPATLERGSAEHAMQNEMRVEAARIGVGQTISVRA